MDPWKNTFQSRLKIPKRTNCGAWVFSGCGNLSQHGIIGLLSNWLWITFAPSNMKALACILSLYALWLSVNPCMDSDCHPNSAAETIMVSANALNAHYQNEICSPFCTCHCSGTNKLASNRQSVCPGFFVMDEVLFSFSENQHSEFSISIWQPPKIS